LHLHNYTTPRQKIQRICVNIIVPCPDMGVTSIDNEKEDIAYFIFGIIWVILVILSVITAVRLAKTERETRVLSALHWFTIGIFAAVLAIFIPVCYTESSIVFGDPYHDLRPLLLAVHSTLRVFIVDVDFEHFAGTVRAAAEQPEAIYVLYTVFSTALFVLAPILTFTNVLSLFRKWDSTTPCRMGTAALRFP